MKEASLVSIIIPVFNVFQFLAEALDSAINQTYSNLEIIIVDDGSTDGCDHICDEYARCDNRIVVIHQENKGLSCARNAGLDIMKGDIVAFLDSDDAYHTDYIKCVVSTMNRTKADIVACTISDHNTLKKMDTTVYSLDSSRPVFKSGMLDRKGALRTLIEAKDYQVWNKIYKSSLWNGIRFPEGHVYEDIDTIYKVVNRCHFAYALNQQLYMHRLRPGSISAVCSQQNISDRIIACKNLESFVEDNIPEVFSIDHLVMLRQSRLNRMIDQYVRNYIDFKKDDYIFRMELRSQIAELYQNVGNNTLTKRKRMLCRMICICPRLIVLLYPVHQKATKLIRIVSVN